jgi:hypothetical protein
METTETNNTALVKVLNALGFSVDHASAIYYTDAPAKVQVAARAKNILNGHYAVKQWERDPDWRSAALECVGMAMMAVELDPKAPGEVYPYGSQAVALARELPYPYNLDARSAPFRLDRFAERADTLLREAGASPAGLTATAA